MNPTEIELKIDTERHLGFLGLSEREIKVLELKILDDLHFAEIGEQIGKYDCRGTLIGTGVGQQRVRNIYDKALRKLQHPKNSKKLRLWVEEDLRGRAIDQRETRKRGRNANYRLKPLRV